MPPWKAYRNERGASHGKASTSSFHLEGIKTTVPFHKRLLQHSEFVEGWINTTFVDREVLGK